MDDNLRETILNLALPLVEAQGLELWGLDIVPGPALKVALYVDAPLEKQGKPDSPSASIDQCESISRQLSLAMDVEDKIDQAWTLEVSSPGLERKFFRPEQLQPYIGDIIEARLGEPLAGSDRKVWRGRLLSIEGDKFALQPVSISADGEITEENTEPVQIDWSNVARARREHIFAIPQKPGKAGKKKIPGNQGN